MLALLNPKLINHFYTLKFKSTKSIFSEIQARSVGKIPIFISPREIQKVFTLKSNRIIACKENLCQLDKSFFDLSVKYISKSGCNLSKIFDQSKFNNIIYSGRARKLRSLTVTINDNILTIYADKSSSGKYELMKFEVNNRYKRQYLKLYLENLTNEKIKEIDGYRQPY